MNIPTNSKVRILLKDKKPIEETQKHIELVDIRKKSIWQVLLWQREKGRSSEPKGSHSGQGEMSQMWCFWEKISKEKERESKGNYRIHVGACWRRYKKYSPVQASPVCVLVWWITLYLLHASLCTSPWIFTANAHFWSLLGATIPPTNKQNWGFLETDPTSQQEQKQAAAARIPPPQKSKISQKFSSCGSKSRSWGSLDMHHLQTRIVSKCWWWWWCSGSSLESCECSSLRDYLPKTRNFMGLLVCSFWIWSRKETGLILLCLKVLDSRII